MLKIIEEHMRNYPLTLAVLSAVFVFPAVPAMHIIFMRVFKKNQKAVLFMLFSFVAYAALLLFTWFRLNAGKLISLPFLAGGFSTAVFFCLGYAEFFFMMVRGFSMRMVADIYSRGSMALPQVMAGYGGKGMDWMLDKRVRGIKALGMVEVGSQAFKLKSPAGVFAARTGLLVKKILKLGKGG